MYLIAGAGCDNMSAIIIQFKWINLFKNTLHLLIYSNH